MAYAARVWEHTFRHLVATLVACAFTGLSVVITMRACHGVVIIVVVLVCAALACWHHEALATLTRVVRKRPRETVRIATPLEPVAADDRSRLVAPWTMVHIRLDCLAILLNHHVDDGALVQPATRGLPAFNLVGMSELRGELGSVRAAQGVADDAFGAPFASPKDDTRVLVLKQPGGPNRSAACCHATGELDRPCHPRVVVRSKRAIGKDMFHWGVLHWRRLRCTKRHNTRGGEPEEVAEERRRGLIRARLDVW